VYFSSRLASNDYDKQRLMQHNLISVSPNVTHPTLRAAERLCEDMDDPKCKKSDAKRRDSMPRT